jgi:hypothetical protein
MSAALVVYNDSWHMSVLKPVAHNHLEEQAALTSTGVLRLKAAIRKVSGPSNEPALVANRSREHVKMGKMIRVNIYLGMAGGFKNVSVKEVGISVPFYEAGNIAQHLGVHKIITGVEEAYELTTRQWERLVHGIEDPLIGG